MIWLKLKERGGGEGDGKRGGVKERKENGRETEQGKIRKSLKAISRKKT